MNKTSITLILFFIFICSLDSYSTGLKGIFYKITTDSSTAYILGSIHFGKSEWYPMDDKIESAFENSNYLVTEIDLQNIDPYLFIDSTMYKDTNTLESNLKPENYRKIVELFGSIGMTEEIVKKFRPWFAAITYQTIITTKEASLEQQYGIDIYFTEKAQKSNKVIKEIETAQSQLEILLKFDNFANELIESSEKEIENNEIEWLLKAWETGNEKEIDELINKQVIYFPAMENLMDEILFKRNERMANSIQDFLKDKKTYFIVIGSGHLVGKKSIIEHLKTNKYKIERLK